MLAAAVAAALVTYTPAVVHDSQERFPVTSVDGSLGTAYGRAVPTADGGAWLQYWLYYRYQDQDRGIVRTGRHEGDWEMVQYRVDASGQPVEAVYAQHAGAERCSWDTVQRRRERPIVYAAHGSHASYFRPGVRDRTWPDPNDEADGRGLEHGTRLVRITENAPSWMARPGPWGDSRARWWVPGEQDSPRGPAFQPERWDDPARWARKARACQAGCDEVGECDGRETALGAGAGLLGLLAGLRLWRRRRASRA